METKKYLELIDQNTIGNRCNVTPILADATSLTHLIEDLAAPFHSVPFEFVAGIDALGFILGVAVALHLNK